MRCSAVGASLLLASAVRAFRDTSPLLVWSSNDNDEIKDAAAEITSGVISADSIFHSLHSMGCDWDTVVVTHVDELHESHVGKLSGPYAASKADLHIPYLVKPERESLNEAISLWAHRCGADLADSYKGDSGSRTVVYMNAAQASDVSIPSDLPDRHIVIVTGTRDPAAKGEREIETSEAGQYAGRPALDVDVTKGKSNDTDGDDDDEAPPAIYFTAPLLTGLLISFGILLPILLVSIKMLAGVQVPPRMMEISKVRAVNKDRKDQ